MNAEDVATIFAICVAVGIAAAFCVAMLPFAVLGLVVCATLWGVMWLIKTFAQFRRIS